MNKILKKFQGITLIALVITIIVLLILAGVSIAMLTGENGILTQAQNAKERTEDAEDKEKIQVAITEAQITDNGYQKLTEENLQKEIDEQFGNGEVRVYANEKNAFSFIFQNKESNYRLEKDGTLNKIDITLKIKDEEDFINFMNEVNNGNTFQNKYVYLLENIDLTGKTLDVIGSYTDDTTNNAFAGIFEGNNRTIKGLNISKSQDYVGLFAYNTGIIRDIILESGSITGQEYTAGITALNSGLIENCHNRGVSINASERMNGGIVARNKEEIMYCSNSIDIINQVSGYVGGIVGINRGELSNCYNIGNIKAVFNTGGISGGNTPEGIIKYCYNLGNIEGTGEENGTNITYSGGISGHSYGKINSCYSIGNIKSEYTDTGGIVGSILSNAEVSNCYSIGEIYNNGRHLGNVVGVAYHQTKIINCYFTREICDLNGVGGIGASTVINQTIEKTLDYMKTNDFVNDLNKDEDAFIINSSLNNGYPVLKWQVE